MLKLMKYELRKTWSTKAILLAITGIAELVYLFGLYGTNREGTMAAGMMSLFFLAVGGILFIGLESVITLQRDLNTKQSYMLFMTPNSCYKILGSKVLECGLSILLTGLFFFALGVLDVTLLFARQGYLSAMWTQIQSFMSSLTINGRSVHLDLSTAGTAVFNLLTSWISVVITAYLAVVISSALLNGKRYNGLISFVLFLLLNWGIQRLATVLTASIRDTEPLLVVSGFILLASAACMYFITARIMDRYLSV